MLAGEEPDGQVEVGDRGGGAGVTLAEEPTCAKAGNPQASGEEREAQDIRVRVRRRARGGGCGVGSFPPALPTLDAWSLLESGVSSHLDTRLLEAGPCHPCSLPSPELS